MDRSSSGALELSAMHASDSNESEDAVLVLSYEGDFVPAIVERGEINERHPFIHSGLIRETANTDYAVNALQVDDLSSKLHIVKVEQSDFEYSAENTDHDLTRKRHRHVEIEKDLSDEEDDFFDNSSDEEDWVIERKKRYRCRFCKVMLKTKATLNRHVLRHEEKGSVNQCRFCSYKTIKKKQLREHEFTHTDKPHMCPLCSFSSRTKSDLGKHMIVHNSEKRFACSICSFRTKWRKGLETHMRTHATDRPYTCSQCDQAFKSSSVLKSHIYRRHSDDKPLMCEQCPFRCKSNFELNYHKTSHSDERPYPCPYPGCHWALKTKSDLTKHTRTHIDEKKHVCEVCGKRFRWSMGLKAHASVHMHERNFECDHCAKRFKTLKALMKHLTLHRGIRPFRCDVCFKTYRSRNNLLSHKQVHEGDRPFKCPMCVYAGRELDHLLVHLGTDHLNDYTYFCSLCRKPFGRSFNLQTHLKLCHRKEMGDADDILVYDPKYLDLDLQLECCNANKVHSQNSEPASEGVPGASQFQCSRKQDIKTEPTMLGIFTTRNNDAHEQHAAGGVGKCMPSFAKQEMCPLPLGKLAPVIQIGKLGGISFCLARKGSGFEFNFQKKGKKPRKWFMSTEHMNAEDAKRYQEFLLRKEGKVQSTHTKGGHKPKQQFNPNINQTQHRRQEIKTLAQSLKQSRNKKLTLGKVSLGKKRKRTHQKQESASGETADDCPATCVKKSKSDAKLTGEKCPSPRTDNHNVKRSLKLPRGEMSLFEDVSGVSSSQHKSSTVSHPENALSNEITLLPNVAAGIGATAKDSYVSSQAVSKDATLQSDTALQEFSMPHKSVNCRKKTVTPSNRKNMKQMPQRQSQKKRQAVKSQSLKDGVLPQVSSNKIKSEPFDFGHIWAYALVAQDTHTTCPQSVDIVSDNNLTSESGPVHRHLHPSQKTHILTSPVEIKKTLRVVLRDIFSKDELNLYANSLDKTCDSACVQMNADAPHPMVKSRVDVQNCGKGTGKDSSIAPLSVAETTDAQGTAAVFVATAVKRQSPKAKHIHKKSASERTTVRTKLSTVTVHSHRDSTYSAGEEDEGQISLPLADGAVLKVEPQDMNTTIPVENLVNMSGKKGENSLEKEFISTNMVHSESSSHENQAGDSTGPHINQRMLTKKIPHDAGNSDRTLKCAQSKSLLSVFTTESNSFSDITDQSVERDLGHQTIGRQKNSPIKDTGRQFFGDMAVRKSKRPHKIRPPVIHPHCLDVLDRVKHSPHYRSITAEIKSHSVKYRSPQFIPNGINEMVHEREVQSSCNLYMSRKGVNVDLAEAGLKPSLSPLPEESVSTQLHVRSVGRTFPGHCHDNQLNTCPDSQLSTGNQETVVYTLPAHLKPNTLVVSSLNLEHPPLAHVHTVKPILMSNANQMPRLDEPNKSSSLFVTGTEQTVTALTSITTTVGCKDSCSKKNEDVVPLPLDLSVASCRRRNSRPTVSVNFGLETHQTDEKVISTFHASLLEPSTSTILDSSGIDNSQVTDNSLKKDLKNICQEVNAEITFSQQIVTPQVNCTKFHKKPNYQSETEISQSGLSASQVKERPTDSNLSANHLKEIVALSDLSASQLKETVALSDLSTSHSEELIALSNLSSFSIKDAGVIEQGSCVIEQRDVLPTAVAPMPRKVGRPRKVKQLDDSNLLVKTTKSQSMNTNVIVSVKQTVGNAELLSDFDPSVVHLIQTSGPCLTANNKSAVKNSKGDMPKANSRFLERMGTDASLNTSAIKHSNGSCSELLKPPKKRRSCQVVKDTASDDSTVLPHRICRSLKSAASTTASESLKATMTATSESLKTKSTATSESLKTKSTATSESLKTASSTATSESLKATSTAPSESLKTTLTATLENLQTTSTATSENLQATSTATSENLQATSTATLKSLKNSATSLRFMKKVGRPKKSSNTELDTDLCGKTISSRLDTDLCEKTINSNDSSHILDDSENRITGLGKMLVTKINQIQQKENTETLKFSAKTVIRKRCTLQEKCECDTILSKQANKTAKYKVSVSAIENIAPIKGTSSKRKGSKLTKSTPEKVSKQFPKTICHSKKSEKFVCKKSEKLSEFDKTNKKVRVMQNDKFKPEKKLMKRNCTQVPGIGKKVGRVKLKKNNSAFKIVKPPSKKMKHYVDSMEKSKRKKYMYIELDLGITPECTPVKKRGRIPGPKVVLDKSQVDLCLLPPVLPLEADKIILPVASRNSSTSGNSSSSCLLPIPPIKVSPDLEKPAPQKCRRGRPRRVEVIDDCTKTKPCFLPPVQLLEHLCNKNTTAKECEEIKDSDVEYIGADYLNVDLSDHQLPLSALEAKVAEQDLHVCETREGKDNSLLFITCAVCKDKAREENSSFADTHAEWEGEPGKDNSSVLDISVACEGETRTDNASELDLAQKCDGKTEKEDFVLQNDSENLSKSVTTLDSQRLLGGEKNYQHVIDNIFNIESSQNNIERNIHDQNYPVTLPTIERAQEQVGAIYDGSILVTKDRDYMPSISQNAANVVERAETFCPYPNNDCNIKTEEVCHHQAKTSLSASLTTDKERSEMPVLTHDSESASILLVETDNKNLHDKHGTDLDCNSFACVQVISDSAGAFRTGKKGKRLKVEQNSSDSSVTLSTVDRLQTSNPSSGSMDRKINNHRNRSSIRKIRKTGHKFTITKTPAMENQTTDQAEGYSNVSSHAEGNTDMPTQAEGNADVSNKAERNADVFSQAEGNTDMSSQAERNDEVSFQIERNIEVCSQAEENVDVFSQAEENAELSSQAERNVEMSNEAEEIADVSSQVERNIDVSNHVERNLEVSSQVEGNAEVSSQAEVSCHIEGNVEMSNQTERNVESSYHTEEIIKMPCQIEGSVEISNHTEEIIKTSTQIKGNVESNQTKEILKIFNQAGENVDISSQIEDLEMSIQVEEDVEVSSQAKENVELSSQTKDNLEIQEKYQAGVLCNIEQVLPIHYTDKTMECSKIGKQIDIDIDTSKITDNIGISSQRNHIVCFMDGTSDNNGTTDESGKTLERDNTPLDNETSSHTQSYSRNSKSKLLNVNSPSILPNLSLVQKEMPDVTDKGENVEINFKKKNMNSTAQESVVIAEGSNVVSIRMVEEHTPIEITLPTMCKQSLGSPCEYGLPLFENQSSTDGPCKEQTLLLCRVKGDSDLSDTSFPLLVEPDQDVDTSKPLLSKAVRDSDVSDTGMPLLNGDVRDSDASDTSMPLLHEVVQDSDASDTNMPLLNETIQDSDVSDTTVPSYSEAVQISDVSDIGMPLLNEVVQDPVLSDTSLPLLNKVVRDSDIIDSSMPLLHGANYDSSISDSDFRREAEGSYFLNTFNHKTGEKITCLETDGISRNNSIYSDHSQHFVVKTYDNQKDLSNKPRLVQEGRKVEHKIDISVCEVRDQYNTEDVSDITTCEVTTSISPDTSLLIDSDYITVNLTLTEDSNSEVSFKGACEESEVLSTSDESVDSACEFAGQNAEAIGKASAKFTSWEGKEDNQSYFTNIPILQYMNNDNPVEAAQREKKLLPEVHLQESIPTKMGFKVSQAHSAQAYHIFDPSPVLITQSGSVASTLESRKFPDYETVNENSGLGNVSTISKSYSFQNIHKQTQQIFLDAEENLSRLTAAFPVPESARPAAFDMEVGDRVGSHAQLVPNILSEASDSLWPLPQYLDSSSSLTSSCTGDDVLTQDAAQPFSFSEGATCALEVFDIPETRFAGNSQSSDSRTVLNIGTTAPIGQKMYHNLAAVSNTKFECMSSEDANMYEEGFVVDPEPLLSVQVGESPVSLMCPDDSMSSFEEQCSEFTTEPLCLEPDEDYGEEAN